jgi:hypothetical protein
VQSIHNLTWESEKIIWKCHLKNEVSGGLMVFRLVLPCSPVDACQYFGGIAVGIATGYRLDDQGVGVRVQVGVRIFFFSMSSRPVLVSTQHPIQWEPGALSLWVKRPGREADHSTPTSAEIKKTWIYTASPPYVFTAQCLISQAQGQFYLTFTFLPSGLILSAPEEFISTSFTGLCVSRCSQRN